MTVKVSAGTSSDPSDMDPVGETAGLNTFLSNYSSSIVCRKCLDAPSRIDPEVMEVKNRPGFEPKRW